MEEGEFVAFREDFRNDPILKVGAVMIRTSSNLPISGKKIPI